MIILLTLVPTLVPWGEAAELSWELSAEVLPEPVYSVQVARSLPGPKEPEPLLLAPPLLALEQRKQAGSHDCRRTYLWYSFRTCVQEKRLVRHLIVICYSLTHTPFRFGYSGTRRWTTLVASWKWWKCTPSSRTPCSDRAAQRSRSIPAKRPAQMLHVATFLNKEMSIHLRFKHTCMIQVN